MCVTSNKKKIIDDLLHDDGWTRTLCIQEMFPFNKIEDNDVLIAHIQGRHGEMNPAERYSNILIKPLQLTEENVSLPTFDTDADSHFCNTLAYN